MATLEDRARECLAKALDAEKADGAASIFRSPVLPKQASAAIAAMLAFRAEGVKEQKKRDAKICSKEADKIMEAAERAHDDGNHDLYEELENLAGGVEMCAQAIRAQGDEGQ